MDELAARWAHPLMDGQPGDKVLLPRASLVTCLAVLPGKLEELEGLICNLGLDTKDTVVGREESPVEGFGK